MISNSEKYVLLMRSTYFYLNAQNTKFYRRALLISLTFLGSVPSGKPIMDGSQFESSKTLSWSWLDWFCGNVKVAVIDMELEEPCDIIRTIYPIHFEYLVVTMEYYLAAYNFSLHKCLCFIPCICIRSPRVVRCWFQAAWICSMWSLL